MGGIALNTDLSQSLWTPMVAIKLALGGLGASLTNFLKRVLLLGHKVSGGSAIMNTPYRLTSQDQANTLFGPNSDLACQYAHLNAQNAASGGAGVEAWAFPVAEVAGTAATRLVTIVALPNADGTPGTNTSAQAAGYVDVYVGGWKHSINVSSGDTFATVAGNIAAEITARLQAAQNPYNTPITSAANSASATCTITANHVGAVGNDLPIRVEFSNTAMKLAASPGKVTFSGTATVGGSCPLTVGSQTLSTTIGGTNTPSQSATALTAKILANPFNVWAVNNDSNVSGEVVLLYQEGRVFNGGSVSLVTVATQTVAIAAGVVSSGSPDLTAPLALLRGLPAFRLWLNPWLTTTSVNPLFAEIDAAQNGIAMKGQVAVMCSTSDLVTAGTFPTTTTPRLTTTPRFAECWCPDAEVRGQDLAAHVIGAVLKIDRPNGSYNGVALRTSGVVPLGVPHLSVRPDPLATCSLAMTAYHLTPLTVDENGVLRIMRGVTTVQAGADELSNWGVIFGVDYVRAFAAGKLSSRYIKRDDGQPLLLKRHGKPQSPDVVQPDAVKDTLGECLDDCEQGANGAFADVVDGADELRPQIQFQSNPVVSGRIDATFPVRIVVPLHQVAVVEQFQPG